MLIPLFINIPLDETVNIIIENLFSENETVQLVNLCKKDQFKCLLTLTTKESCFLFGGELYQQVDGAAMASFLDPTLANIFFIFFATMKISGWLGDCSLECKQTLRGRYFCSF